MLLELKDGNNKICHDVINRNSHIERFEEIQYKMKQALGTLLQIGINVLDEDDSANL